MKYEEWIEQNKEMKLLAIKELNVKVEKLEVNSSLRTMVSRHANKIRKRMIEEERLRKEFNDFREDIIKCYCNREKEELLDIIVDLTYKNNKLMDKNKNLLEENEELLAAIDYLEKACDQAEYYVNSLY